MDKKKNIYSEKLLEKMIMYERYQNIKTIKNMNIPKKDKNILLDKKEKSNYHSSKEDYYNS